MAIDFPEINVARSHLYNCITAFNVDFEKIGRARLSGDTNSTIGPESLEGFEVPTLFITAEKDMVVSPQAVEIGASLVPDARLVNLGEAGHSSYFEIAEAFNKSVENFLDEVL